MVSLLRLSLALPLFLLVIPCTSAQPSPTPVPGRVRAQEQHRQALLASDTGVEQQHLGAIRVEEFCLEGGLGDKRLAPVTGWTGGDVEEMDIEQVDREDTTEMRLEKRATTTKKSEHLRKNRGALRADGGSFFFSPKPLQLRR